MLTGQVVVLTSKRRAREPGKSSASSNTVSSSMPPPAGLHTSLNKATNWDQVFKSIRLWGHSRSNHHSGELKATHIVFHGIASLAFSVLV